METSKDVINLASNKNAKEYKDAINIVKEYERQIKHQKTNKMCLAYQQGYVPKKKLDFDRFSKISKTSRIKQVQKHL